MNRIIRTIAATLSLSVAAACTGLPLSQTYDPLTMDPLAIDAAFPPAVAEVTLTSHGARLPGILYLANGEGPHPTVVLAHGYPGNEKNLDLAQTMRRSGFNVLFFHYRGAWGADGTYSLTKVHEDVLAALAHLRGPEFAAANRIDTDHLSAVGHSMGGFAVLRAASMDADLQCVAGMSSANLAAKSADYDADPDAAAAGFAAYTDSLFMLKGFSGAQVMQELEDNRAAFDPASFTEGLKGKSVFLITGEQDQVTPADRMQAPMVQLFSAEPEINLSHAVIPGDHSFSWSRQELASRVTGWLNENCR